MLKLTLAPALVAVATAVSRRFGRRLAGLVSGLPVVAAPIVGLYVLEQGEAFGREAAAAAVLGLVSQIGFCVTWTLASTRAPLPVTVLLASGAFAVLTAALSLVHPPLAVSVVLAAGVIVGGVAATRRLAPPRDSRSVGGDLLVLRLLITALLVLAVTSVARELSAHVAGLLVPIPVITAVMAGFTQAQAGPGAAVEVLAGLELALLCFLVFFVVLAIMLDRTPAALALVAASVTALVAWGALVAATSSPSD